MRRMYDKNELTNLINTAIEESSKKYLHRIKISIDGTTTKYWFVYLYKKTALENVADFAKEAKKITLFAGSAIHYSVVVYSQCSWYFNPYRNNSLRLVEFNEQESNIYAYTEYKFQRTDSTSSVDSCSISAYQGSSITFLEDVIED